MIKIDRHIALLPVLLVVLCAGILKAQPLSETERRGKRIFLEGTAGEGSEIVALLSGAEVPAPVLPCGSCHGAGGKGNAEGGVTPSDIRWASLVRNYSPETKTGRKHPAYNEVSVAKAITLGIDPAGNALHKVMPRYRMSADEMAALIAYLKRLESDVDEGISPDKIKIACLLPPGGNGNPLTRAAEAALQASFDHINQNGGIYNRQIEAVMFSATSTAESSIDFLRRERPFALCSSFISRADSTLVDYLDQQHIPLCGAITEEIPAGKATSPAVFYLYARYPEQALTLAEKAIQLNASPRPVIVLSSGAAQEMEDFAIIKKAHGNQLELMLIAPGNTTSNLAQTLAAKKPDAIICLGGIELCGLLKALKEIGFFPAVLASGSRAGKDIFSAPIEFHKKVVLAFPTWLDQISDQGFHHYRNLQQQYGLPAQYQHIQMTCMAAAELLIDRLKGCGAALSREKLVNALENGQNYHSGLIPDVTFTPNQHVGSIRVFLLELDLEKSTLSDLNR